MSHLAHGGMGRAGAASSYGPHSAARILAFAIQAGAGRRVIDSQPTEARNALEAIEATSRETLAGLRRMLTTLRHAGPADELVSSPLDPAPGLADLGRLTATTQHAGVRVEVRWRGQRRPLPAEVDRSAFRIIQEALTNVVRHADASHCQVAIDQRDEPGCGPALAGSWSRTWPWTTSSARSG